ncbi:type II and III secretion system protein family protein [Geomonas azotofigens]|uniref:type II and III secretion system protein family protein n=1 Tax=Geomonas azotofigens TaxID=2843196 RepID=UPI001C10B807|nr:BON domain-containing protein [Geomonas azotofigens]MBU5612501.1 BON domain-containing protein [Geomonas azotofigens]
MIIVPMKKLLLPTWALLLMLAFSTSATAGVPLEVGLYKSVLVDFKGQNKKIVLVTLANTNKEAKDKDVEQIVSLPKAGATDAVPVSVSRKRSSDSDTGNTNKFVVPEVLSEYILKLDGIMIGSTSMIIWTKGEGDERPAPTFFDLKVTGDRQAIESQLKEMAPNETIDVQYANDTVVLSGNVANDQTKAKALEIAKSYAPKVINNVTVNSPQQVLLEVKVAQVDKSSLKELGFSFLVKGKSGEGFSNVIAGPNGNIAGTASGLGNIPSLDTFQAGVSYFPAGIGAVLKALSSKGHAKVLAEPNLLVRSSQEGNFLAGSKIPIAIVESTNGQATTTIKYEPVGIRIKFKPEVMENGMISLKIMPAEVSSIQGFLPINGYPIIDSRTIETSVELRDGESLVLAGLLQEEEIKNMSKIPLLGDIPILGALFRTNSKEIKEKELVFCITPKLVKAAAPGTRTVLPTDRKLTPEQEKELSWMPLGE